MKCNSFTICGKCTELNFLLFELNPTSASLNLNRINRDTNHVPKNMHTFV